MGIDNKILNEIKRYKEINTYIIEQEVVPPPPIGDTGAALPPPPVGDTGMTPPPPPTGDVLLLPLMYHQHQSTLKMILMLKKLVMKKKKEKKLKSLI